MTDRKASLLIVDDEPDILKVLVKRFFAAGYDVISAANAEEAWSKLKETIPDLMILDVMMPEMDGFQFKEKMNQDPRLTGIPVIFLSARSTVPDKVEGLSLQADDYVTKPFAFEELLARVKSVLARRSHYEKMATTDSLTGLADSHIFRKQLEIFFNQSARYRHPFSLAVMDIDEFKNINDTHGHLIGNSVLLGIADIMRKVFRQADVLVRLGGDEFAVLFSDTPAEHAAMAINRFRQAVREKLQLEKDGKILTVSLSVGLAAYSQNDKTPEMLFDRADKLMYEEKQAKKMTPNAGLRILIVEDEEDILKVVDFRLKKAGFQTLLAEDGEEGLRMAKSLRPDLVLLDLMLPKISGEEVCKSIREDEDEMFAKTPILMLTAKNSEADRIVGKVIGANIYMTKPFQVEELLQNIIRLAKK